MTDSWWLDCEPYPGPIFVPERVVGTRSQPGSVYFFFWALKLEYEIDEIVQAGSGVYANDYGKVAFITSCSAAQPELRIVTCRVIDYVPE